jgi:MFS-type transporter involved in bile tolerance (Atg22 family)
VTIVTINIVVLRFERFMSVGEDEWEDSTAIWGSLATIALLA